MVHAPDVILVDPPGQIKVREGKGETRRGDPWQVEKDPLPIMQVLGGGESQRSQAVPARTGEIGGTNTPVAPNARRPLPSWADEFYAIVGDYPKTPYGKKGAG